MPKASPVVAFPQAQPVELTPIFSSIPTRTLGTSMHAPGNEMVNNSAPHLPLAPIQSRDDSAPRRPSAPIQLMDETLNNMMKIMFMVLTN